MVLRLVRALYGGKGSAGLWDTEYGFVRSLADPRLYVLIRGTARISMVLATDDTAIGVPSDKLYPGSKKLYRTYVRDLQAAFQKANGTSGYTDKGLYVEFIGVGVDQTTPGEIILDMTATARNIVKKHGFTSAIRCLTPAVPHIVLSERDCIKPGTEGAPDQTAYRSRIGSMLWITRCALPIAAYQTGALARMNHAPGHAHWNASSTLLRWLATCADPRLRLHRTGKPAYMYVDSDFLPNYGTVFDNRRSTSGFCAFLAGACVSHTSRRQKTIATSTAHAEYLAAFEAGRAALRIRILLADMGLPQAGATTPCSKTISPAFR
jgi:KUP system potassium uptake protein